MNVVLFHIGRNGLPEYQEDCFAQYRLFNPDLKTYFLTDKYLLEDSLFKKYDIQPMDKNDFHSSKIDHFITFFKHGRLLSPYQFWIVTALRLIYIENFMKSMKLKDVYHFENDVLIYRNISTINDKFQELYPRMAITPGGPDKCITGFMYIHDFAPLSKMTEFFVEMLRKYGKPNLMKMYGMDMVNEMTLMRAFSKEYPDDLQFLPILPFGEWSTNFEEFGSLFDPASYGQFIGGSAQDKIPGLMPSDHYIGQYMRSHPEVKMGWMSWDHLRVPFVIYDGVAYDINNLHIHSKNLHLYKSK